MSQMRNGVRPMQHFQKAMGKFKNILSQETMNKLYEVWKKLDDEQLGYQDDFMNACLEKNEVGMELAYKKMNARTAWALILLLSEIKRLRSEGNEPTV